MQSQTPRKRQENAKTRICPHQDICRACDSDADRGTKLELSRTAQRNVFALWVFTLGAIGRALPIDRSQTASIGCRPAGRMNARTADHARAWLQETERLGEGPGAR